MARAESGSLRFSRLDTRWLLTALALSLLLHVAVWGGYEIGKKFGWWQSWHLPAWQHKIAKKTATPPPTPPEAQPEIFVDVTQPDATPPEKTIYYSDKNSHAANPDEDKNSNQPKLNGKQTDSPKTETTPRLSKLQPSPPPQPETKPAPDTQPTQASQKSSPMNLGDVKAIKTAESKPTEENKTSAPKPKPRTLKEAMEQQHLPGLQMKQDGGAHRRLQAAFDAKASPLGDYDSAVINAVTQRWYNLLDSQRFAQDRTGRVVVRFKLEYDGTVEDVEILENTVGTLLGYVCQTSIEEAAPFGKWPDDMRRMVGANYREITFTFYYY